MDQYPADESTPTEEELTARRSNITNWLLGGILVVVVAIGAVTFFGSDDSDTPDASFLDGGATTTTTVAPGTTTTLVTTDTTVPPTTTTTEATTTTTTTPTDTVELTPEQQAAADAVTAWIAAIASGDGDSAWNLIARASQDVIGTRSDFNGILTELEEGFGAWSDVADLAMFINPVTESGEGSLMVVTMTGTVTQEGISTQRAAAIPVFLEAGGVAKVQPFLRGDGLIEFVTPIEVDPPYGFGDSPIFDFTVPGQPMVLLYVDDAEVTRVTIDRTADSSRVTAGLSGVVEPGLYVLTVIYLDEGIQHASAVLFSVGEGS